MIPLMIAALVIGAGGAVPLLVRSDDRRKAAAAGAARQAEAREERDRQVAADEAAARQAAAAEAEQRELAEISSEPARHLWRMMVAAWQQRIQGRKQALVDARRGAQWAREDADSAQHKVSELESEHPWVANSKTRQIVEFGYKAAFVVIPMAYILDRMITTSVYEGIYGELLAPFALVLVGIGCLAATWALGLGERNANVLRSTGRMLTLSVATILVLGTTWVLMLWAPARPDHQYGPQIKSATTTLQIDQQAAKPKAVVTSDQAALDDLTAKEKRWEKVDQGLVGLQVLLEGGVAEAVMLSQVGRRRRDLSAVADRAKGAVRYADAQVDAVEADLRQDAIQVVARMSDVLTRIAVPLQDQRQMIMAALESSNDLDVYHSVAARVVALPSNNELPAADVDAALATDVPMAIEAVTTGDDIRQTTPVPAPASAPEAAHTVGTVADAEEVPMPTMAAPTLLDLDALDEAL